MEIIGGREPKNLTIDSQASEMVTRSVSKARAVPLYRVGVSNCALFVKSGPILVRLSVALL